MQDTYVIRIYRREAQNPEKLVGIVEEVGHARNQAFNSVAELCEILRSNTADKPDPDPGS